MFKTILLLLFTCLFISTVFGQFGGLTAGRIDDSFGYHGVKSFTQFSFTNDLDVLPDGKILFSASDPDLIRISRFFSDGERDMSFGVNGSSTFSFPTTLDIGNKI